MLVRFCWISLAAWLSSSGPSVGWPSYNTCSIVPRSLITIRMVRRLRPDNPVKSEMPDVLGPTGVRSTAPVVRPPLYPANLRTTKTGQQIRSFRTPGCWPGLRH